MALLTPEQDQLLEPAGFYAQWLDYVTQGFTREKAYELTEHKYQEIRPRRAYSDFSSFDRQAWRFKKQQQK